MLRLVLAVFLAALCCPAGAAPPRVLIIHDGGYKTVSVVDGVPANVPFDTVLDFRSGDPDDPDPPTDPDDPDDPEPDIDEELAQKVQAWAEDVGDPQGAQAISWAYTRARGDLSEGKLDPQSVWPALAGYTRNALEVTEGSSVESWKPFADKLDALLNDRIGELQAVPAILRAMASIQHGIDQSSQGAAPIDLETLDTIYRRLDR